MGGPAAPPTIYFLGGARGWDQPGSLERDRLAGQADGLKPLLRVGREPKNLSAVGRPSLLTPRLRWSLPEGIFAREKESQPLLSALRPGPAHDGLAHTRQEGEERKRRHRRDGFALADLPGAGQPQRSLKPPSEVPAGTHSAGQGQGRGSGGTGSPASVAAPCNLTLGSPGRPTTKKLRPRQQLAVSSQELHSSEEGAQQRVRKEASEKEGRGGGRAKPGKGGCRAPQHPRLPLNPTPELPGGWGLPAPSQ